MAEPWFASFEIRFPASTADELLLALIVRDLVHGSSYDVVAEQSGEEFQVDVTASDELDDDGYLVLFEVEINGEVQHDTAREFFEEVVEGAVEEAETLRDAREDLDAVEGGAVEFRSVPEDDERWDLVIPDWLAPEDAEVPFGFRGYLTSSGAAWPSDAQLDACGRVIVVPFDGKLRLVAIPAPDGDEDCAETNAAEGGDA